MSRRHKELQPVVDFNAIVIRKLNRGEAAIYRDFRIFALTSFAANFMSSAAEARARPMAWYRDRIETEGDPRHFIIGAFNGARLIGAFSRDITPMRADGIGLMAARLLLALKA